MNYDNELDCSKSQFQWWRLILFIGLVFTFGMFIISCEKENEPDEYYVKYEVNGSSQLTVKRTKHTTINGVDNIELVFDFKDREWEKIIGPVQNGFNATLEVSCDYDLILNCSIYVSKNDSPFALKKSDESDELRDNLQISYIIDY